MVESNLEAARPRRRPARQPAMPATTDTIYKGLDRFGLAPIIVLVGGWWISQSVLAPLIQEYREAIRDIDETNELLKDEIARNNREDDQRVEKITGAMLELRAMILAIQDKLDEKP